MNTLRLLLKSYLNDEFIKDASKLYLKSIDMAFASNDPDIATLPGILRTVITLGYISKMSEEEMVEHIKGILERSEHNISKEELAELGLL